MAQHHIVIIGQRHWDNRTTTRIRWHRGEATPLEHSSFHQNVGGVAVASTII